MGKLRIALWSAAAVLGVMIAARWVVGPFVLLGIPVNVPLNLEGVFGLLTTAVLATTPTLSCDDKGAGRRYLLLLAPFALAALWPALRVGFLSDDFILVKQAREFSASTLGQLFTTAGGDGFFRPLGYLSFDFNAIFAGTNPPWWHLSALLLHATNAILVAMLATRLGASQLHAFLAGALFALHGTHLEAAVWIAGRFDLLAALFTLGALLMFGRSTAASLALTLAALWSKEAAFVLPALITLLAWHEKKSLNTTLSFWAVTAGAFVYRWTLLGGIGGYTAEQGGSAFYSLKLTTTAKAVFVRLWTSLYFPLNWSREPSLLLGLLACAYIGALLWIAWRAQSAPAFRVALAGLALSILPPLHLLGGAADLSGGRLLYLPSIWFCLMIAFALSHRTRRETIILTTVLLMFHLGALRHDLPFWIRAGDQVRAICEQSSHPAELPRAIEGVPALANGFAECIERPHQ